jgi:hypothetical protein
LCCIIYLSQGTAHATLIHYAQCEYFGDDLEASTMSPSKKGRTSGHISFNNRCISEWETAKDVFAEAPFELRVAQKFKENIRDEETAKFLAEELGTVTRLYTSAVEPGKRSEVDLSFDLEDDGTDDDFDNEEDELDDESLAEEVDLERQFAKETIDRDELDALSFTSDDDDDNSHASSTNLDDASNFNSATHRPRRSKRKRFTLPEEGGDINEDGNINGMRSSDIGTLDVANIVRGKRSRTKVDYRK